MRWMGGALVLVGILAGSGRAIEITAYHIGNSLTRELPVDAIAQWATLRGHTYQAGHHVQNGARLDDIWQQMRPTETSLPPYGSFYEELPTQHFEVLTLQPYFDLLNVAEARIADFRNLAANTDQVYLFQAWPRISWGDYRTSWESPWVEDEGHTLTREFYRRLLDRLPADTRIIPTGEVFYELAQRVAAGTLPGVSQMSDFYAVDACTCHLNSWGNFVLATTVYATLFQESPVGLPVFGGLSTETGEIIEQVAWQVIANHRQTGVTSTGDFDGDGAVTTADYERWTKNYKKGIADASGYVVWRNNYVSDPEPPIPPEAVPEPASWLALLALTCGLCAGGRWRSAK